MIRHTVMFTWRPDATEEQIKRVPAELSRLPALVPSLKAYSMGTDIGVNEGNWQFAATADFDDLDGYLAYRDDPTHQAIIKEHIRPIIATRAAVQFEL
ncbi:MAG TPA: Dabb family protein [Streptosporangiaceae bacterium]|nr:Dabb family protein [Streptosporangiaceae bacterium]